MKTPNIQILDKSEERWSFIYYFSFDRNTLKWQSPLQQYRPLHIDQIKPSDAWGLSQWSSPFSLCFEDTVFQGRIRKNPKPYTYMHTHMHVYMVISSRKWWFLKSFLTYQISVTEISWKVVRVAMEGPSTESVSCLWWKMRERLFSGTALPICVTS